MAAKKEAETVPPAEDDWDPFSEAEDMYRWKLDRFAELGFNNLACAVLVVTGADWHEAERLLAQGASLDWTFSYLT